MALTSAQQATVKADILANSDLNSQPNTPDGNQAIADLYNLTVSPAYYMWYSTVPCVDIHTEVIWSNYTPNDAADSTVLWQNRAMNCQLKQKNLELLVGQGRAAFNATRQKLRDGLQDATTNLPTGNAGANRSGGWNNGIQLVLSRQATRIEKLLATGTGTQASPGQPTFEGAISGEDVRMARNS